MVRYQDLLDAIGQPAELFFYPDHLPVIDPPAFDDESPGRVHTGDRNFVIEVEGLQVFGYIPSVGIEPPSKPRIDVVQGDVMVSRHNDLRGWKRL
jgi:hypothetical protein